MIRGKKKWRQNRSRPARGSWNHGTASRDRLIDTIDAWRELDGIWSLSLVTAGWIEDCKKFIEKHWDDEKMQHGGPCGEPIETEVDEVTYQKIISQASNFGIRE